MIFIVCTNHNYGFNTDFRIMHERSDDMTQRAGQNIYDKKNASTTNYFRHSIS